MSLLVNLAQLARQAVHLEGRIAPADWDLDPHDELLAITSPVTYTLTVRKQGKGIFVEGSLRTEITCACARCLKEFRQALVRENLALYLPLEGEDQVTIRHECVDLTPYLREDMVLALPQHPLCEPGCSGLPSAPPGQIQEPGVNRQSPGRLSEWAALDQLKL